MKAGSALALGVGAAGLIGGLAVKLARPMWANYGEGAMAAGALVLVAFLWVERAEVRRLAAARQAKYGLNAALYTLIVGAVLGAFNYIGARHVQRLDLTDEKIHSLSEQTVKVVKALSTDVSATAFYRSIPDPGPASEVVRLNTERTRDILTLCARTNPRFKFAMVDPDKDPTLTEKMGVTLNQTTVFECAGRKTFANGATEEAFVNAIVKVTRATQPVIYLLQGEGELAGDDSTEHGISRAREELKNKSYEVKELNLGHAGEVPRDCSMLLVADPHSKLPEGPLAMIRRYLDEGGRAMILLDVDHDSGLGALLDEYGIAVGNDRLIDPSLQQFGMPPDAIVVGGEMWKPHTITERFRLNSYFALARSVGPRETPPPDVTVTPLFACSAAGWAEMDLKGTTVAYDAGKDKPGPVDFGVAATWKARVSGAAQPPPPPAASPAPPAAPTDPPASDPPAAAVTAAPPAPDAPATPKAGQPVTLATSPAPAAAAPRKRYDEGRLVVVGDADFASNQYFMAPAPGNFPLFMNMVNWLGEAESLIAVPAKKPKVYQVNIPAQYGIAISIMTLFVIPAGVLAYGLGRWWRRRRL